MRIVIPTGIFPPDIGGPASYVPRIALALQARGHSVQVITLAENPSGVGEHPFPVRRIRRGKNRLLRMGETIHEIYRSARKADLLYANGLFIEAVLAAALARKPLVMKIVGDWAWERARNNDSGDPILEDFQSRRQSMRWEIVKCLRKVVSRRANRIIVPSRYLQAIVAGWRVPQARIDVVYNAVDPLPGGIPPAWQSFSGQTLLSISRLVRWKGIDTLMELLVSRPDLRLFLIGDGPDRSRLETKTRERGIADRAIFLGSLAQDAVAGCLRAADAFVLPSLYEGLPHVVLEAFAAGTPVVATAVGGTPEVIEHGMNGLLIPPGNPGALAVALDNIFSDSAFRNSLIENSRRSLETRFRWDTLIVETERVLIEAAGVGIA